MSDLSLENSDWNSCYSASYDHMIITPESVWSFMINMTSWVRYAINFLKCTTLYISILTSSNFIPLSHTNKSLNDTPSPGPSDYSALNSAFDISTPEKKSMNKAYYGLILLLIVPCSCLIFFYFKLSSKCGSESKSYSQPVPTGTTCVI